MTLLAYGGQQTDDLQLHRPEICYPAFGFALTRNEAINLPIVDGVGVPARRLIAQSDDQKESVIYWSRIGEYLPTSSAQQREDRLRISLAGVVPDGLLSRFSTVTDDPADAWKVLETFIPALIRAVPAKYRKVLIGTERARSMMQVSA
jgi:EpsI family protein